MPACKVQWSPQRPGRVPTTGSVSPAQVQRRAGGHLVLTGLVLVRGPIQVGPPGATSCPESQSLSEAARVTLWEAAKACTCPHIPLASCLYSNAWGSWRAGPQPPLSSWTPENPQAYRIREGLWQPPRPRLGSPRDPGDKSLLGLGSLPDHFKGPLVPHLPQPPLGLGRSQGRTVISEASHCPHTSPDSGPLPMGPPRAGNPQM